MAYSLTNGLCFEIDFQLEGPAYTVPQKDVTMRQSACLTVIPQQPEKFEFLRECLYRFVDLIALGVGKPLHGLKFTAENEKARTRNGEYQLVDVVEGRSQASDSAEDLHPASMLFPFAHVRDRFDQMVEMWFKRRDILERAYILYFATARGKQMHVEHRFLNLFHALESYHRRTEPVADEVLSAHRARIERLLAAAPESDRAWLKEKLEWSHEATAINRLKSLVRLFGAQWLFEPSWKDVIREIVSSRNYLTHYNQQAKQPFSSIRDLYNHSIRLQMLCEVAFLHELGFENEEIQPMFIQSNRLHVRLLKTS